MAIRDTSKSFGYQQLTGMAASTALAVPTVTVENVASFRPQLALLQAEGQNVRWRDDGIAPTATVGMLLIAGSDPYPYDGVLTNIRFIQAAGGAILNVSFYA